METLTRKPQPDLADQAEAAPPAPPAVPSTPEAAAEAPVRTCDTCGAALAGAQDWCLECGTAAPGRLGKLPGLRAAATVVLLTLVLAGGAVAASYAALTSDAGHQAAKPAPASGAPVVAQAPPVTPPVAAAPVTPPPAAPLPKTKVPASKAPAPAKVTPAPVTHTPAPAGSTPTSSGGTGTGSTTPAKPKPQPIDLGKDAASLYDPYGRATVHNEPARALDGNDGTSLTLTAKDGPSMDTGLAFDLGSARGVKVIELKSKTPGYRIEVYATDSAELPPDILDTRWAHITNHSNLKSSERIVLGGGATKYRHVLIWITTPPKDGSTVSISEATLLG